MNGDKYFKPRFELFLDYYDYLLWFIQKRAHRNKNESIFSWKSNTLFIC